MQGYEFYKFGGTMSFLKCDQCGRTLFTLNEDGLIQHDHGQVREIHGICECGHGYHYALADCYLKRLLARYNHQGVEV